jgi:predicted RND superfamily exporter protein
MHRLFESLRPFIRGVIRNAGWVLALAAVLTLAGLYLARNPRIDSDLAHLIPDDRPTVEALNKLRNTVGGETSVEVGIVSPSFEANKAFAEDLIDRALDLEQPSGEAYFTRAEFEREVDYLKDNALYFASRDELNQVESYLEDQIEQAKLEANPFYFGLDEEEEEAGTDSTGRELEQMYDNLVGKRYPISDDSTTMVVRLYPSGTNADIDFIEQLYGDLGDLVDRVGPTEYHAQMEVTLAGRLYRRLVEIRTIQNDVLGSLGSGILAVLLLVVSYFFYKAYTARTGSRAFNRKVALQELVRTPIMALIIGVPLLMSLAWAAGFAFAVYDTLNLMTSTLGLVLFGLGIDFGIHFYGRYAEERAGGLSITDAAEATFVSTGQAISIGAMTTSAALFVLAPADFKGFSEFGVIAGTGILFALVAMTVVMPALLAVLERTGLLDLQAKAAIDTVDASAADPRRYPAARPIVVGSLLAVVTSIVLLPQVGFQYDFGALEPDYEQWDERNAVINRVSSGGESNKRNPAYVVADSREDVPKIVEKVREKAQRDTTSPTILSVESLQERFPLADSAAQNKLQRIAEIREMLGSKYLEGQSGEAIDKLRRAAQTREKIALDEIPEFLQKQFTTKTGEIGTFVMIYPSVGLSDGRNSIAFLEDVGTIRLDDGTTYHAASTSLVAADMLRIMRAEAPWMVGATFLIVALLMLANFRSFRWAALALVPLVVGILWMLLLMEVFGLMLNFYNMIVLPAVLGIGNDAGVHMVHRYREEGGGSIRAVLRSTGEHVTIGSLTTMIGFAGLLLSFHPGLNSIGSLAVAGIGTTLVSAVFFLPALLQWLEDRGVVHDDTDTEDDASSEDVPASTTPEEVPS